MARLIFIKDERSGESVELVPPGISIGRETDNDLSLLVSGISRYHAKFEWRDAGWYVLDLGSTNGVTVNETKITEPIALKNGDEIVLDKMVGFRFEDEGAPAAFAIKPPDSFPNEPERPTIIEPAPADISQSDTGPVPLGIKESTPSPDGDSPTNHQATQINQDFNSLDFFGSKSPRDGAGSEGVKKFFGGKSNLVFYVAVIGAAVIFVSLFLINEKMKKQTTQSDVKRSVKRSLPLLIVYEKEIIEPDNIFRYTLSLENGVANVTLDDLKHQRHFSKVVKDVDKEQLSFLESGVKNTSFMKLTSPPAGVTADGSSKIRRLVIGYDQKLNNVQVKNTFAPSSFEVVEGLLEDFSSEQLGVRTLVLTVEEMKAEAERSFHKAEQLYQNRDANPINLKEAIKRFKITMEMLEPFVPKPEIWDVARKRLQESENMLKDRIKSRSFNAEQAFRTKDYVKARDEYRAITEMSDPDDAVYQKAREKVIKLDSYINKVKKK